MVIKNHRHTHIHTSTDITRDDNGVGVFLNKFTFIVRTTNQTNVCLRTNAAIPPSIFFPRKFIIFDALRTGLFPDDEGG